MKMTAEKIAQAQKMRDEGMFYREIGAALAVSGKTVKYHLDSAYRQRRAEYRAEHLEKQAKLPEKIGLLL